MQPALSWLAANAAWLVPTLLYVLSNVANGLSKSPSPVAAGWVHAFHYVIDIVSVIAKQDAPAVLKMPFQRSLPRPGREVLRSALPVLFVSAFGLAACATTGGQVLDACEKTQLSQFDATLVADIIADLSSGDWEAALAEAAQKVAPGQLDCLIRAVVAWASGAQTGSPAAASRMGVIAARGQAWLLQRGKTSSLNRAPRTPADVVCGNPTTGWPRDPGQWPWITTSEAKLPAVYVSPVVQ